MDGTKYSSKQDTNTSLNGKQMQTSTQLRGSRDISPSMLDLRGIKSLENKVKPGVVTHAHHTAAKCNIIHQSGWTVCTGSQFIFPYCYDTRGLSAFRHIVFTYTILGEFLISLFKEGNRLPYIIVLSPFIPFPFLGYIVQQPEVLSQQEQSKGRAPTQPLSWLREKASPSKWGERENQRIPLSQSA